MDDTLLCPICGNKMRNLNIKTLYGKLGTWIERTCNGMNHSLQLFATPGGKVDMLKLSLNPKYSKFLEIDFANQKCRIICMKGIKDRKPDYIDIAKMIEPDFPDLVKLKERVALYVTFS